MGPSVKSVSYIHNSITTEKWVKMSEKTAVRGGGGRGVRRTQANVLNFLVRGDQKGDLASCHNHMKG